MEMNCTKTMMLRPAISGKNITCFLLSTSTCYYASQVEQNHADVSQKTGGQAKSRWWLQISLCSPLIWRNDPFWRAHFSNGWFNHQLAKSFWNNIHRMVWNGMGPVYHRGTSYPWEPCLNLLAVDADCALFSSIMKTCDMDYARRDEQ